MAPAHLLLALCGFLLGAQADRLADVEAMVAALRRETGQEVAALRQEVSALRAENAALRQGAALRAADTATSTVTTTQGRQLSADSVGSTCCRWTHDGACGTIQEPRFLKCTGLHEYLEEKTTSVEFEDLDACLGTDETRWSYSFDPTASGGGHITLKQDGVVVATPPTPLRVTHRANCSGVAPTLTVQLAAIFPHAATFNGGVSVNGMAIEHSTNKRILRCRAPSNSAATSINGPPGKCARNGADSWDMGDCNLDHDEVQLHWFGEMLASSKSGVNGVKCMTVSDDHDVRAGTCNHNDGWQAPNDDARRFYFYFDGDQLKNRWAGPNKCFECGDPNNDANLGLYVRDCLPSDHAKVGHQQFYWWLPGDPFPTS